MNKQQYSLGSLSIPLFLILTSVVLSSFAMLSLMSAKGDMKLSQRALQSSVDYYEAYGKLQMDYELWLQGEETKHLVNYLKEDDLIITLQCSMQSSIFLVMDIQKNNGEILSCRVENSSQWEVDESLPLWNGE